MAVATGTALAFGASALMGGIQAAKAGGEKRKYERELRNLPVPELDNAYKNMGIPTSGLDFARDINLSTSASAIDAARSGGARTASDVTRIVAENNKRALESRKYIDDLIVGRDRMIAREESRNKILREQRYQADVSGLGARIAKAEQDQWSGLRSVTSGLMYMGRNMSDYVGGASGASAGGASGASVGGDSAGTIDMYGNRTVFEG